MRAISHTSRLVERILGLHEGQEALGDKGQHALCDGATSVAAIALQITLADLASRQLPGGVVIHRGVVPPGEREERDGYRVTTSLRTLTDIAATPASWPSLEPAIRDALRTGRVRRRQLLEAEQPAEAQARLVAAVDALDAAEQKAGV